MQIFRLPAFIRRYIRRNFKPPPMHYVVDQRLMLSALYMVISLNAVAYLGYKAITVESKEESPTRWWHSIVHRENKTTKYTIKGLDVQKTEINICDSTTEDK